MTLTALWTFGDQLLRIGKVMVYYHRMLHGILSMLELCEVKVSCTVLRGLGAGNSPRLPDVHRAVAG